MSVQVRSVGEFDFSYFELSTIETALVRTVINYDFYNLILTKNIRYNQIFYHNKTGSNNIVIERTVSKLFDLLESYYIKNKTSELTINILCYSLIFKRLEQFQVSQSSKDSKDSIPLQNEEVTWTINIEHFDSLKNDLFDFVAKIDYCKKIALLVPNKNNYEKTIKI